MPNATCIDPGDTAWVLLSFILVLGMMPALAFFEAGLLRSKNTLSLITQILAGLVILSVMWDLFGFSLVYGPDQVRSQASRKRLVT
jgi:Amt family ammonium transporter